MPRRPSVRRAGGPDADRRSGPGDAAVLNPVSRSAVAPAVRTSRQGSESHGRGCRTPAAPAAGPYRSEAVKRAVGWGKLDADGTTRWEEAETMARTNDRPGRCRRPAPGAAPPGQLRGHSR